MSFSFVPASNRAVKMSGSFRRVGDRNARPPSCSLTVLSSVDRQGFAIGPWHQVGEIRFYPRCADGQRLRPPSRRHARML